MILTPLSQHDLRLRQICAPLTKAQLRDRQQQVEIDAILNYVYGELDTKTAGRSLDHLRPHTVGVSGNQLGILKQVCVVDLSVGRSGYSDLYTLINPMIVCDQRLE